MKKLRKKIAYIVFLFLFFEAAFRIFISIQFETSFFQPSQAYLHYYPELRPVLQIPPSDEGEFRILVLGGSVVYADTIPIQIGEKKYRETFCNIPDLISKGFESKLLPEPISVYSLAIPAHNTLDSRYKYEYLKDIGFDLVFLYHGINDTRSNNISSEFFDPDYRHIEFYNDLYVLRRHAEINITVIPFFLDLLWEKNKVWMGIRPTIPREHFEDFESPEAQAMLQEGRDLKSKATFRRNVEWIMEETRRRESTLLLSTYAWYSPENYNLKAFQDRKLDYTGQVFPTEIYGISENVKSGLIAHNEIIRELGNQKKDGVIFQDFEATLPKNGMFFDDICHLSDRGCNVLGEVLISRIFQDAAPATDTVSSN